MTRMTTLVRISIDTQIATRLSGRTVNAIGGNCEEDKKEIG